MSPDSTPPAVPPDFKPLEFRNDFNEATAQIYRRKDPDGSVFGFLAGPSHANINRVIHGGMLMTFADTFMGQTVAEVAPRRCATVSFNVEFVTGIRPPAWIEGRAHIVRMTQSLVFMRGEVTSGGHTLMTASGIWKMFRARQVDTHAQSA